MNLYEISSEYVNAFLSLADSELPDEVINDTLEGLEGEFIDKGKAVIAFILNLEAEAEAMRSAEKRIADRRKIAQNKVERLKDYLRSNMEMTGIKEIKADDFSFKATFYPNRDESVVIDNEEIIPAMFFRVKKEADKTAIKSSIKNGVDVPGAHIEKKSRLEIK